MNPRRNLTASFVVLVCLLMTFPAVAQFSEAYSTKRGMEERFRLDIGGFFQKFDTIVTIEDQNGHGTEVNLEDLGQSTHQTNFRLGGYWRFGPHGRLDFGYHGWHRSGERTLDREIQIGDTIYQVGAQVSSENQVNVFEVFYSYSFVNTGALEVGAQLGLSAYYSRFSFDATGNFTGPEGSVSGTTGNEYKVVWAPIPSLGGYVSYTISPGFFVFARARGLPTITVSGYSGNMVDVKAGLDYYFTKNFGIGGGYEYTKLNFSREDNPFLMISYKYSGPLFYLSMAF